MAISIHVPHTRDDCFDFGRKIAGNLFQSTSLTRGTTRQHKGECSKAGISIHVPHTRDDLCICLSNQLLVISIHVPHTRDDFFYSNSLNRRMEFQSTSLTRGTTGNSALVDYEDYISIHVPHTRHDLNNHCPALLPRLISIHVPHTRDDAIHGRRPDSCHISIHVPHTRDDAAGAIRRFIPPHFNPRPSHEGRPVLLIPLNA